MGKLRITLILLGVAIVLTVGSAHADTVIYDFEVTATHGELVGNHATGTFSFDDSIIPSGGGSLNQVNLLTDLNFTWHGIVYDQNTANTGWLTFDASESLIDVGFGNHCASGSCTIVAGYEQWIVSKSIFYYSISGGSSVWGGTSRVQPGVAVPEPSLMVLLGISMMSVAGLRRWWKE